ncbi:MAG: hypothetical protein ACLP05_08780 [Candidatus Kryptoniota bacterium]
MKQKRISITRGLYPCLILIVPFTGLLAQKTHSDNGDGAYTNPLIVGFSGSGYTFPGRDNAQVK